MPRYKNQKGYWETKVPDHPFANSKGYVREHRLIAEEHLRKTNPEHPSLIEIDGKKYLRRSWDVHHDGIDKTTKDPEKLPPIKHDEHAKLHIKLRNQVKKETEKERETILRNILTETIERESEL